MGELLMRLWNLLSGAGFCALGLWIQRLASSFPPGRAGVPGPGFYPVLLGWSIFGLGLLLLLTTWRTGEPWVTPRPNERTGGLAVSIGLIALFALAWRHVRFELTCLAFSSAVATVHKRDLGSNLLLAVFLTLAVVAVFRYGLRVLL